MARLVTPTVRKLAYCPCVFPVILRDSLFENPPDLPAGRTVVDVNVAKAPALLEIHTLKSVSIGFALDVFLLTVPRGGEVFHGRKGLVCVDLYWKRNIFFQRNSKDPK